MRIRQIVFAAHNLPQSREALAALFALPLPFRDPGVAEFGIDNAVFTFGDQFIEVISPVQADTACGRHLARQGDGGYMLLLQTDNLTRERAHFAALGVRHIWSTAFDDISAMHLHPKDVGAAIVSVDEPRPATAWRWGGPHWQVQAGRAGSQRVRGVTLQARQPQAMAQRWAQVFSRPPPTALDGTVDGAIAEPADGGWRVQLTEGFADFWPLDPSREGPEGIMGFTLAVVDPPALFSRARDAGLPVQGGCVLLLGVQLRIEALLS